MNALIDRERVVGIHDTGEQAAAWTKKLEECGQLWDAYQDQQAAGLMTLEKLGSKIKGLEETRRLARAELVSLEAREERVKYLEKDRDALVESWFETSPEDLDRLTGDERNKVYRMLRLEVAPQEEGYSVTGALRGFLYLSNDGWREATVKKLKGARLCTPSRLTKQLVAALWIQGIRVNDHLLSGSMIIYI